MDDNTFTKTYVNIDDDEATLTFHRNPEGEGEQAEYAVVTKSLIEGLLHQIGFRAID